MTAKCNRFPDAVQRAAKRNGAPLFRDRPKLGGITIPGLQRIIALRFMLRPRNESSNPLTRTGSAAFPSRGETSFC